MQTRVNRAIIQMVFAALCFSLMAVFTKWACTTVSPFWVVFFRSFFGTILMAGWMTLKRIPWTSKKPLILFLRGGFGFGALALHFYTIAHLDLGTAVMLNYTAPIFVVVIAYFLLRERVTLFTLVAVTISFFGLYLLAAPQFNAKPLPILLGVISGICAAFAYVLIRYTRKNESPYLVIFYFTVVSTLASVPLVLGRLEELGRVNWFSVLGVTASAFFGQIFLTKSIQEAPVSTVLPFAYLTPIFAAVFGTIFWREYLTPQALIGALTIILSGVGIYLASQKRAYIPLEE